MDIGMDHLLGPFTVIPTQIANLGAAFTPFVNALLRVEVATAGLSGSLITTTYLENIGDEGVDAGISRAGGTRFIPAGDSAWQFKRGDLGPSKCAGEIAEAASALEVLRSNGKYRLVLGADINDKKVKARRKALREKVASLQIELADDSIEVLTASDLAEWAQSRPSLAVSQLLGGIRGAAEDFTEWAESAGVATKWVASTDRQGVVDAVRSTAEGSGRSALHVEGVSGLGKSRTVLEALRGQLYESLVIYVRDAETFPPSLIRYLTGEGRTAILVVDDCDPKQHKNLEAAIPTGSGLKLITIGEPGPSRSEIDHLELPPIEETAMAEVLKLNRPNLWPQASQFVTDVASGNVRLALFLSGAIESNPRSSAAALITKDIIEAYVTQALPAGTSFLACCALALFTRIGYDAEMAGELRLLAEAVDIGETELRAGARALAELNLLTSKGRFRSVAPQPLAVYLAMQGWDEFGTKIAERLLFVASTDFAERLLQRAAEVGPSAPVLRSVSAALDRAELFGSLSAIRESGYSHALIHLGILAPAKVTARLSSIVSTASDAELRSDPTVHQNLVWALEKLAWHSNTFDQAATALLRLAINETENYRNNASGSWCSLFGVMLPTTAARPATRMTYLKRIASSSNAEERTLAGKAAASILEPHESAVVSAELQRGVVVEPRGRPATYDEIWEYQRAAIQLLRQLVDDEDKTVAAESLKKLVSAIHPLLEHQAIRGDLFAALKSLPGDGLREVRTQVTHLQGLFQRAENVEGRQAGLELLYTELPRASKLEELHSLAHTQRWDLEEGQLQSRITGVAREISAEMGVEPLLVLTESELPAAFELGRSLADIAPQATTLAALTPLAMGKNSPVLEGYLWGLVEAGSITAFDDFLDKGPGRDFDSATRLSITVRGPQSSAGWHRVEQLMTVLPVWQAARGLFGWHIDTETPRLITCLSAWLDKIETQYDYNAVIDFVGLGLFRKPAWMDEIDDLVAQLVQTRKQFPDVGQQRWTWTQLAKRQIDRQPIDLLRCVIELIDVGAMHILASGEERNLIKGAISKSGTEGWGLVTETLLAGSWRVKMDIRGWFIEEFSPDVVTAWIGTDVERAKLVASVAAAGADEPTPVARYLLEHFDTDSRIAGSLAGEFWSGSWWGNESDRLAGQIAQLQNWVDSPTEPEGVKRWARNLIQSFEQHRERALLQEAEEDFT